MNQDAMKKVAAEAALNYIKPGMVLGVGSGSTVHYFIEALKTVKGKLDGAVASSNVTAAALKAIGIPLVELNNISELPLYVDGADEVNDAKQMIKGGGGAHTREKIIATAATQFVCIVDSTKVVDRLGNFPIAVEVLPMARSFVARQLLKLGGDPVYRQGVSTDNDNVILDVYNLDLVDPLSMEQSLNNIPGVVANGLFAKRRADVVLVGTPQGMIVR